MTLKRKRSMPPPPKKRPYLAPTLKTYGNLQALTKGKGGSNNDGSAPKTRMGGPTG